MSCPYYTYRSGYYCTKKQGDVNSDIYYKYCRNYDYSDCPIYKGKDVSGCYLTTACVVAKNLPDDCDELQTLRNFRDTYMRSTAEGEADVKEYYAVAPKIVSAINNLAPCTAHEIWVDLYNDLVLTCCKLIKDGKKEEAYKIYKNYVLKLKNQFL